MWQMGYVPNRPTGDPPSLASMADAVTASIEYDVDDGVNCPSSL
jgi:hypothetical protein